MKLTIRSMSFGQDKDGRLHTRKRDRVLIDNEASAGRNSALRREGGGDQPDADETLRHKTAGESLSGRKLTFVHRQTGRVFTGLVRLDRVMEGRDVVAEFQGVRCWIVDSGTPQPDGPRSRLLAESEWDVQEPAAPTTDQRRTAMKHAYLVRTHMFQMRNTLEENRLSKQVKAIAVGASMQQALTEGCRAVLATYGDPVPDVAAGSVDGTEALLQQVQSHVPELRFESRLWDIGDLIEGTKGLVEVDALALQEHVRQDVAHLMDICGLRAGFDAWTVGTVDFR